MNNDIWSKAQDDAEFAGTIGYDQVQVYYKNVTPRQYEYSYGGNFGWSGLVTGTPACLPLIKRPQPAPWSGEGLPPVGTIVGHVVSGDKDYPFIEWAGGDKLEVIAHRDVCGAMLPIVFNLRHNTATAIQPHLLKPIRTPEQIAADERQKVIADMVEALGADWPTTADYVRCGLIYDAGWRKI
jgi:hypothetical protein